MKDQLKALGGRWNPEEKAWMVPADKADEARRLVSGAPKSSNGNHYHPRKCIVCGAVPRYNSRGYADVKILRSGECVDCYEERKMGY